MARILISQEQYDLMVEAFREQPGNASHAGRKAGCTHHTAKRAYERGYPDRGWIPIKEIVQKEADAARAARERAYATQTAEAAEVQNDLHLARLKQELEEKEQARQDAIRTRKEEGQVIRAMRGVAGSSLAMLGQINAGGIEYAKRMRQALESGKDPDTGAVLTLKQQAEMHRIFARAAKDAAAVAKAAIECERLIMGQPTEIIGISAASMTEEDALHVLEVGQRAMERTQKRLELVGGTDVDEEVA